jgi:hypothetical protein
MKLMSRRRVIIVDADTVLQALMGRAQLVFDDPELME